jgi:hypothetical protein
MSKRIIVTIIVVLAAGLLTGGFFLMKSRGNRTNSNPVVVPSPLPGENKNIGSNLTYEDSSGFSFKYPNGIKVEDITPNEGFYYSLLNLSKDDKEIKISAQDTKLKNISQWVESKDVPKGLADYGAVSLGGLSAKQFTSANNILLTVAIDQGVLYLVSGPKDNGFWENTQNDLVSTFTFAGKDNSKAGTPTENIVDEGEEIVE